MKKVTLDEAKHIAELSRLEFDADGLERQRDHLEKMLWVFETLDKTDVSDVPPTAHILSAVNVLRDDRAEQSYPAEELLKNAPETDGAAYIVPRVVE